MNNNPENENITETEEAEASSVSEDSFSTIFSAPAEHKKVEVKKKKVWLKILAGFLCLAILAGGTFGVIKLIPKLSKDEDTPQSDGITVLDMEADDIESVTVTNKNGTVKLCSNEEKSESGGDTTVTWFVESVDPSLTGSSSISAKVYSIVSVKASREITEKTLSECGFDSPTVTVTVKPRKGEQFDVAIGGESPDNSGCYLKYKDKIYLVESSVKEDMEFTALDFANASNMDGVKKTDALASYFSEDTLSGFDKLTLTGKNFKEPLVIVNNTDERVSSYLGYMIKSPSERIADKVDVVFNLFKSGVSASGAYSFTNGAADLKKFGLDNPDLTVKMELGNYFETFKFKLQDGGDYAAVCTENPFIFKVAASSLEEFINKGTEDFYSGWITFVSIDDIKNLTITSEGKKYSFDIVQNEVDEDSDEEQEKYDITCNGKKLVALNFQHYYQYCLSVSCKDFTVEKISGKPDFSLEYNFKTGIKQTVEFIKANDTMYQYSVDGKPMGKVNASDISKLSKYVEKLANGETIDDNLI